jgi:ABC-2 type transport system ATP-binding protein
MNPDLPGPIIETQELTREFKTTVAVDSLDLTIYPGELFGLVGPDGAGKTTTLRLLAGIMRLTVGSATIAGYDLGRQAEAIKPMIGYMAQRFSLYSELSVVENLHFFADLYDLPRGEVNARMARLLDFAGLSEFQDRRADHLSGGMQKKLALACTLIHEPDLLILDEPTTGVDPISRREFWNILTDLHVAGTTIVVSTPYMDEADRCSRVGLIYQGRLVVCDTPQAIRSGIRGELIAVHIEDRRAAAALLQTMPGILEVQTYGDSLHIRVDSARKRLPQIKRALKREGLGISSIRQAVPRMEEAFISLIKGMEA